MEFQNTTILRVMLTISAIILTYLLINTFLKKALIKKVRTKRMKHNIIVFISLISYLFVFISIIFLVISVTGTNLSLGVAAGLLTAGLGWALQRPITGVAAWVMIITSKPFEIGDRIIVGGVKGDVGNITLTHIHLKEFGGTIGGEETSGRIIFVPNSILFEQNIINYTSQNNYILDEVTFTITYASDVEKANEIARKTAERITKNVLEHIHQKPFTRSNFQASGVDIRVRYYTIAENRQEISSNITEEISKEIKKEKTVQFAYPHTEVFLNKRK
ncbi:mechanosensitive ion channel family protein [Candidatus Pacearchaeota archaeon]|nr:mechanosensitive ion channel family protein [Candidatus Pacearchaeota archaeon]